MSSFSIQTSVNVLVFTKTRELSLAIYRHEVVLTGIYLQVYKSTSFDRTVEDGSRSEVRLLERF